MNTKEMWKPVTIGGVTGILMGAGTMYAVQSSAHDANASAETGNELKIATPGDELSFESAFNAARSEIGSGGIFHWRGNLYNTYTEEEWNRMSHQDKNLFAERVKPEINASDIDTSQQTDNDNDGKAITDESKMHELTDNAADDDNITTANNNQTNSSVDEQTTNSDVRIVGFGHAQLANGNFATVEELDVNGQRVTVIDVDNDGVADYALSDLNNNHLVDDGEIIDLHTGETLTFTNEVEPPYTLTDDPVEESAADIPSTLI
ncbi:MAG: hypothetical protein IJ562_03305 [Prevotella sp.]|nr:hypothetical protein [Prevotella sp.]